LEIKVENIKIKMKNKIIQVLKLLKIEKQDKKFDKLKSYKIFHSNNG